MLTGFLPPSVAFEVHSCPTNLRKRAQGGQRGQGTQHKGRCKKQIARCTISPAALYSNRSSSSTTHLLPLLKFNSSGLVAAIAQQYDSGEVLMMAWMNEESIIATMSEGRAVYYSRSRQKLWRKGDISGQVQMLKELRVDCDGDAILLLVDQKGVACHTGRRSCFFRAVKPLDGSVVEVHKVLADPEKLYPTNT